MRDLRRNLSWTSLALVAAVTAAGAAGRGELPSRFVPALDGTPVIVDLGDGGRGIAAWAYRAGAEYDIAIAARDEAGFWGPPQFIGALDRIDQMEPSLAVDRLGNVYLAFSVRPASGLYLSILPAGSTAWTAPVALAEADMRAMGPALRVVGDRLAVGFRSGRKTLLLDLPLYTPPVQTRGIQDGPDGVDPLGATPAPISPGE